MNEILKYKNYIGSVEYDLTNKLFFGQILFIDDLVTYEGNTIEDLEKAFRDMVDDYLETCKEIGKKSQKDKRIISFDKDGKNYFVSEQEEIQRLKRMNEEIIIDGVSSENGYFIPNPERGLTAEIVYLKQENEKLKKERDILLGQLVINDGEDVTVQISQSQFEQYNKYRSALEEIREILEFYANSWVDSLHYPDLKYDNTKAKEGLKMINEVLDE